MKHLDLPTYVEALTGDDAEDFFEAMNKEICELESKQPWVPVPQQEMKT